MGGVVHKPPGAEGDLLLDAGHVWDSADRIFLRRYPRIYTLNKELGCVARCKRRK